MHYITYHCQTVMPEGIQG